MSVNFEAVVFLILAVATVGGAIGCVYGRRVAHSLLFLMLTSCLRLMPFIVTHRYLLEWNVLVIEALLGLRRLRRSLNLLRPGISRPVLPRLYHRAPVLLLLLSPNA